MEEVVKEERVAMITLVIRLIIDFFASILLIGIYWFIRDITVYATTRLTITNRRVNGRTGLFKTEELDCPLNKVDGVQVHQTFLGKIFDYGTISITTNSRTIRFMQIQSPNEFKSILSNQIEKYEYDKMDIQANKIANAISNKQ